MSTSATTEKTQEVETIRVKVDGKSIDVPKMSPDWQGNMRPTTMLEACQLAGVEVPHYCYHHKLPVAGNCRMCLVSYGMQAMGPDRKPLTNEDGTPKIVKQALPYEPSTPRGAIACATPIAPNMEIYASSEDTREMREGILESLLINHPLDCPICDQAGECKLQEYSVEHGQAESRFAETKVHKPKQVDLGPRIMLDDERCILCSRCVRFSKDIADDDALGFLNRGGYNTLAAAPGREFDNNYTLNTVDLCPVGALTSKDFRFQMRVWFLKETKSVCGSCATGCNMTVGAREGRIYRFEPRENEAVNSCWMCDDGRLNYKWVGREDRISNFFVKRGSVKEALTWEGLRDEWMKALQSTEKGTLGIIGSARMTTEELFLLQRLATQFDAKVFIPENLGDSDTILVDADKNPNTNGARLTGLLGDDNSIEPIREGVKDGSIRRLIAFYEDVMTLGLDINALEELELFAVCDFSENETTSIAHFVLPGCAYLEKRGTFVNKDGRVQKFMKAVEAPGLTIPEWEWLRDTVISLGALDATRSIEGLFNQMAESIPAFQNRRWADIGDTGLLLEL